MWMSKAYYQTADELLEVAHKLRQRRIPCDVITLDGRAWHKPETRFDFSWDPDRYSDPAGFVRTLRQMNLRLCLWEYPYLSTKNPLFKELDAKGYFLKNPDGSTYIHRWFPPPMDTLVPHLQPSGIVDFTNPEAYAWFRDMHHPLIEMGVAVMKPDYGEAVPEDVVGYNGDSGKRLHNVYSLLYNRCVFEAFERYAGKHDALVWSRGWLGWRYRLIPYLEQCTQEASQKGMPVQRAMALAFPDDPPAWGFETQYLFGPALLVAPVLRPGGLARLYLPAGGWYDLWSGERLEGPRYIEKVVPLEQLPIYGREGATLILGPAAQHTGELHNAPTPQAITFGQNPFRLEL